jgi:membrane protein
MARVTGWFGRLFRAMTTALSRYGPDGCPQFAAAIAYHVLLSIFPFVLLVASIAGFVLRDPEVRARLAETIVDRLPVIETAGIDLDRALNAGVAPLGFLGLVGLVTLLWSASGMMGALRVAFNRAWRAEYGQPYLRGKLLDFIVVVLLEVLVLAAVGLSVVREVVAEHARNGSTLDDLVARGTSAGLVTGVLGPLVLVFGVLVFGYRYVPVVRPAWRDVLVGAFVGAVGTRLLFALFAVYTTRVADYTVVYGSLATLVAFLLLVYLSAGVVLFGAEVAAAWPATAQAPIGPAVPLRTRVRGLLRGLVSRSDEGGHSDQA